ncbi:MAG: hypothetical protein ACRD2U_04130 [Terriglobales bacterium]
MYVRIARKLGVDPSYVSRVARGERQSPEVESALNQEIAQITRKLGSTAPAALEKRKIRHDKRLRSLVAQEKESLQREWLQYSQADPNMKRIKLSARQRAAPVLPVVKEALGSMQFSLKELAARTMRAANKHGKSRRAQGYTPTILLEEYNLIRRCIHNVATKNLDQLDRNLLLQDLGQLGEVLDYQSQSAIRGFLGNA